MVTIKNSTHTHPPPSHEAAPTARTLLLGRASWYYNSCLAKGRKTVEATRSRCRHGPRSRKLQGRCLARCARGPRARRHLLLGGRRRQSLCRLGLELLPPQHIPGAAEAQLHQLPAHLLALQEGKDGQGARLVSGQQGCAHHRSHLPTIARTRSGERRQCAQHPPKPAVLGNRELLLRQGCRHRWALPCSGMAHECGHDERTPEGTEYSGWLMLPPPQASLPHCRQQQTNPSSFSPTFLCLHPTQGSACTPPFIPPAGNQFPNLN